jgi:hypothetical protein
VFQAGLHTWSSDARPWRGSPRTHTWPRVAPALALDSTARAVHAVTATDQHVSEHGRPGPTRINEAVGAILRGLQVRCKRPIPRPTACSQTGSCRRRERERSSMENTCASERSEASHATGASRRSGERGRVWGSLRGASPQIKFGGADETRTRDLRRDRLAPTSPERSRLRKIGVGCPRAWSLTADCGRVFWNALQVLASEIHKHRGREPGHLPASSRRRQTSAVVFRRQASQSSSLRKREHPDSGDSKPADLPKSARHFPRRRCSDSRTVNR